MRLLGRLGNALMLLGLIALMIFLLTLSASQEDLKTLLLGACLSALGLLLRRRSARSDPQPPDRFRSLRRLLNRSPPRDEL